MVKVLEERVDVSALKGNYPFSFHDPNQSVFRARKGLDREISNKFPPSKANPLGCETFVCRHSTFSCKNRCQPGAAMWTR